MDMQSRLVVPNSLGIHARPAALLVKAASVFNAEIQVKNGGGFVDGKSLMGWLSLGADKGTVLTIRASGQDADRAVEALAALFENSFNES
ncbi:MAG: HPr family phosphocarrier protein [Kiritimatiellia bacterium]